LTYPRHPGSLFKLSAGKGLQALVVVASAQPLPEHEEWRQRVGALPWGKATATAAWRFDGRALDLLGSSPRGEEVRLDVPAAFESLCRSLQERAGADIVQGVAFPVR
jgi:hypothetical protein